MNLSPHLATLLSEAGIAATHWSEIGAADATDREIMGYAKAQQFVVLTHDLDFSSILAATNAESPSVVQIRAVNLTPEILASPVINGLVRCERALAEGALLTIEPSRLRLRLLPLNRT